VQSRFVPALSAVHPGVLQRFQAMRLQLRRRLHLKTPG
jgi:hypothetical protein